MNIQTIALHNEYSRSCAMKILGNLPVDDTIEIVIQPRKQKRSNAQNALFWGARLKEISEQAWVGGKQFSSDVWHEHLKREYLPEGHEEDFERMVRKGYVKWEFLPNGERQMVGSTTQLTTYGMTVYMTKCESYAAQELGVRFSADRMAA